MTTNPIKTGPFAFSPPRYQVRSFHSFDRKPNHTDWPVREDFEFDRLEKARDKADFENMCSDTTTFAVWDCHANIWVRK